MIWCGRRDSNSHGKPTRPLKPTYFLDSAVLSTPSAHNRKGKMATFRKLKNGRWQVIVRKPNYSKIYKLTIKRFDLNPRETLFIDDRLEIIVTAKNLGFMHSLNQF